MLYNVLLVVQQSDQLYIYICIYTGFPSSSDGKESACNVGSLGWIPGLGRPPGGGHGNPPQYSCLENPHGQRSLAGYSPCGHKELDVTERRSTAHIHLRVYLCVCTPGIE